MNKIRKNEKDIRMIKQDVPDDAEVVVISYGITSRIVTLAIEKAKRKGIKVGNLRLIVVWPFPEEVIRNIAQNVKAMVVVEMNCGQIYYEVERCCRGKSDVHLVPHSGGMVHDPEIILEKISEAVK